MALRRATAADAPLYLKWVNAADSIRWKMRTREPVGATEHTAWFERRLRDPFTLMWVIEDGSGHAVGQLRLQQDGDVFAVDIYVDPPSRRSGLSLHALDAGIAELRIARPGHEIIAEINKDNVASRRFFEAAGFECDRDEGDWVRYRLVDGNRATSSKKS